MNSKNKIRNCMSRSAAADGWGRYGLRVVMIILIMLLCASGSFAYSVLTHEEIIDLVWTDEIRPLLLQRFPALTKEQITEAHAYAYGGAVIQDLRSEERRVGKEC